MSEARRLGRNFFAISVAQLLSQLLTFVLSISLARALGVEQYGIFVFAFSFSSWFLLIASLGLDSVVTIDVAADKTKAGSYITSVAVLRVALVLGSVTFLWITLHSLVLDEFSRTVGLVLGISGIIQTYANTFISVFQAFERLELRALVTVVERITTTGLVLLLLALGSGLLAVSSIFVVGSVLSLLLSISIMRSKFVWFSRRVDPSTVISIAKKALPFAAAAVLIPLRFQTGPVLLAFFQSYSAAGHFNAAFALLIALLVPVTIYNTVSLPTMSRIHAEKPRLLPTIIQKTRKIFFLLGLPIALGGWFFADDIITLIYGQAFHDSARSFGVLMFSFALSTAMLGFHPALAATGRQKINLYIMAVGACTNLVLSLILIPMWGHVGAAVAFFVSHITIVIATVLVVLRMTTWANFRETLPKPVLAGVTMILILYALQGLSLWIAIAIASLSYFFVLVILKGIMKDDLALVKDAIQGVVAK